MRQPDQPTNFITVRDHSALPASELENFTLITLCNQLADTLTENANHHGQQERIDLARAALNRAAAITHMAYRMVKVLPEHDPRQQQLKALYLRRTQATTLNQMACDHTIPGQPQPPISDVADQHSPNHYWPWLQLHVQALNLLPTVNTLLTRSGNLNAADQDATITPIVATLHRVLKHTAEAVDSLDDLPTHAPTQAETLPILAELRHQARLDLAETGLAIDTMAQQVVQSTPIKASLQLQDHPELLEAITDQPLHPAQVRTTTDGQIAAVMHHHNHAQHARLITEPAPDNISPETQHHLAACLLAHCQETHPHATSVILTTLGVAQLQDTGLELLTPIQLNHLIEAARNRSIPDSAIRTCIHNLALTQEAAASFVFSYTSLDQPECTTEQLNKVIAVAQRSGLSTRRLNRIVQTMGYPQMAQDQPKPELPLKTAAALAQAALEGGINPQRVRAMLEFNQVDSSHQPATDPTRELSQVSDQEQSTICPCPNCLEHNQDQPDAQNSLALHIQYAGRAHAVIQLSADLNNIATGSATTETKAAVHQYAADSALDLLHFILNHQQYPGNPHHDLRELIEHARNSAGAGFNPAMPEKQPQPAALKELSALRVLQTAHREHIAAYHLQQLENTRTPPRVLIHHAAALANLAKQQATDQLDPTTDIPLELDRLRPALAATLSAIAAAQAAHIIDCTPELVSELAAEHPELVEQARHDSTPLNQPAFTYELDFFDIIRTPVIIRFLHQDVLHYQTYEEPYPAGYPSNLANHNNQAFTQHVRRLNSPFNRDMLRRHQRSVANLEHAIPDQTWQTLAEVALHHDMDTDQLRSFIIPLSTADYTRQLAPLHPTLFEPPPKPALVKDILDAAQNSGMDRFQQNRLADALDNPQYKRSPAPTESRHIRAISRAAHKVGMSQRMINTIQDTLAGTATETETGS